MFLLFPRDRGSIRWKMLLTAASGQTWERKWSRREEKLRKTESRKSLQKRNSAEQKTYSRASWERTTLLRRASQLMIILEIFLEGPKEKQSRIFFLGRWIAITVTLKPKISLHWHLTREQNMLQTPATNRQLIVFVFSLNSGRILD